MNTIKQKGKKIIEISGLGGMVDRIRYLYQLIKNKKANRDFIGKHPHLPLPNSFMIYETFKLDYKRYYESGKADTKWIIEETEPFLDFENKDILDWGCGPGRIIRHFPEYAVSHNRFWACDYNEEYVNWCAAHIPHITFKKNQLSPPLPFDDCSMDLIYGISIFTHLSEDNHYQWRNELYRVLRKDGILFTTTHGVVTRQKLLDKEKTDFDGGKLVTRGNVKEGYRMYCAYHPPAFIKRIFTEKFEILKHIPGKEESWGLSQDVWILKRR